ncbi:MAG TPA: AraC family transcriptional regulator [Myxococcales bacterium]|nr:AraC family transcriptional regulator [Myxococcales bacterium]
MRAAGTIERFLHAPAGAWVAGRCFLVWNFSARLGGSAVWGTPTEDDVARIFDLADAYRQRAPGCDVVTDVSGVETVDATAYQAFAEAMTRRAPDFAAGVRRHALVRSGGLMGGLAEGFFPLAGLRHLWRIFSDAAEAFAWVGGPEGPQAMAEVVRLVEQARGQTPALRSLRDYLRTHLREARLASAAVALGTSERTLHRTLRVAGTCFRDELAAARVEAARELLAKTDLKIEEIARRAGCASHAHLTNLFKRKTGRSPAAYRARSSR